MKEIIKLNILLSKKVQEIILSTLSEVKNSNDVQKHIIHKIRAWIKSLDSEKAQLAVVFVAEKIPALELSRAEWADIALKLNDPTNPNFK